jgi:ABC-type oligopeptide transport system ATPase subunit
MTAQCLTRRFGTTRAVDKLTFGVLPRVVTGSLGANGSGKPTTTRIITVLDVPTFGSALTSGKPFASLLLSRRSHQPPPHYSPTPLHRQPAERLGRPTHLRPQLGGPQSCAL